MSTSAEEASQLIEASKSTVKAEIATIEAQLETHKKTLSDLKVQLYAKFGSNINLEAEED